MSKPTATQAERAAKWRAANKDLANKRSRECHAARRAKVVASPCPCCNGKGYVDSVTP